MAGSDRIRDVWAVNLEEEFDRMRIVIDSYPYVSMDTEFPGVVARPMGNFQNSREYQYQLLRCNCNILKLIQLGITLSDANGNLPPGVCTWQFHFKFNLNQDMYAQDSIELLSRSGIDFESHEQHGIDVVHFAELLMSSGFVLNNKVYWITYHSLYDFGYLMRLLLNQPLPAQEEAFFELFKIFFPCIYDIKHMIISAKNKKGGLNDLADELQVQRIGPQHQAGSDSLLTCHTFFKMKQVFFESNIDPKYTNIIHGIGVSATDVPGLNF